MKSRTICCAMGVVGLLLLLYTPVQSQEHGGQPAKAKEQTKQEPAIPGMPEMTPETMEMMAKWQKTTVPGQHHQALGAMVGEWTTLTKIWMGGPGTPPMESTGTSTIEWALGGRYIKEITSGTMMGQPFDGIGFTGYDNYKNMYVFSFISNHSTEMLTGIGMVDPSQKVFTFYGQMDEPMLDVYGRTVKYVTKIVNQDKHVFQIIDLHAGEDYKVIEVEYTRKN